MALRILIIEDNAQNLELMSYLLTAFGHSVTSAGDGESGLVHAEREIPDLIICDIQLPKISGYEVSRHLGECDLLKGIPLIAVTALAMMGDKERILAAGFDGYISKPINPETFVQEIETIAKDALSPLRSQHRAPSV